MQWDAGIERAHLRLHRVVHFAQLRISGYRFQMTHHRHGFVQRLGSGVQRGQGIVERSRSRIGRQPVDPLPCIAQQFGHGRPDMLRADLVERDSKRQVQ